MNGHRRDDVANDIDDGYPTLSPEVDALAAEVSRLSTFEERQALSEALGRRVVKSPSWGEWTKQPDRYLADLDAPLVEEIRAYLTRRRDKLRARAASRGWELPDESR